jgi:Rad3-related DNA helicase
MTARVEPWKLGLPHSSWKTYQYEAYVAAKSALETNRLVIMEAPVGIGKTAIAGALSDGVETTVLVQNLGLLNQYQDYGFSVLMGRQEYECADHNKVSDWKSKYGRIPTAFDCHHTHNMRMCPYFEDCPYFLAREEAFSSPRMACTYKYGAVSDRLQKRGGLLVMDEIHNAVREFLGIESFSMSTTERKKHSIPDFIMANFGEGGDGDVLSATDRLNLLGWTEKALSCVGQVNLFDELTPLGTEQRKMFESLSSLQELLFSPGDLFYKCKLRDIYTKKSGKTVSELVMEVKPLSPKSVYASISSGKESIFMMSATIGDPQALICNELGTGNYSYKSWPHPVPASKRPVYDIANYAMTHSNITKNPSLYNKQAGDIANWINKKTDRDWRGIVLTTSHLKVRMLRNELERKLRDGRKVFASDPDLYDLQERIDRFVKNKDTGTVQIDTIQGWGTGVDLRGDIARYSVVAGVPLSNPVDRFDSLRFSTPEGRAYAYAFAYNSVMQATGRVSRGEVENGEYTLNTAALADKLATAPMAMAFYSQWFKDAITKT